MTEITIEEALHEIAMALKYLGNGDASTPMGAIEGHAVCTKEAGAEIAMSIDSTGAVIARAIEELANAVREKGA